jgi:hypothetical protein
MCGLTNSGLHFMIESVDLAGMAFRVAIVLRDTGESQSVEARARRPVKWPGPGVMSENSLTSVCACGIFKLAPEVCTAPSNSFTGFYLYVVALYTGI